MDYDKVYKKYYKYSLWIAAALYLIGILVVQLTERFSYIPMLTISAVFSVVTASIYGGAWKAIVSQSPAVLNKFYLAASGLRMLLAFMVISRLCLCGEGPYETDQLRRYLHDILPYTIGIRYLLFLQSGKEQ